MVPAHLKYTKTHEWLDIKGNIGTIGITDFAVNEISEIVYVELPQIGKEVTKNVSFGVIESVKAVFDLFSPANGKVIEINKNILDSPQDISKDPYGNGWLIKIELLDNQDFGELLNAQDYEKLLKAEQEVH